MKLIINNRILDLSKTQIMGILNVTPDSFFDGGQYNTLFKAIDHTASMIDCGANLIDIGGESTRPTSDSISDEEEAARVVPVVDAISRRFDIFISVNTSKALVIRESAAVGADLINDVRSLTLPGAIQAAISCNLPVCLVHMQGNPKTMQVAPVYSDVVSEVNDYFIRQIKRCELAGLSRDQLIIDPGFGFGKSLTHNYQLLSNLRSFHHFNCPILVGMSRKSMLDVGVNQCQSKKNRLIGSIACVVIAAMQKIQIVRVHDVKETAEALGVVDKYLCT